MRCFSVPVALTHALGVALLLGGLPVLSGCQRAPAQSESKAGQPLPVVYYTHPKPAEVTDYAEFVGRLDAAHKVGLQAMVTGYLVEIGFKDGQDVEKDQILFKIDPSTYKAAYDKAAAVLRQTQARLERLEGDLERARKLFQEKAISREDFERLSGDRLEAAANVGAAQSVLSEAKVNLEFTEVRSPFKGRASRTLLNEGNMVKANETMLTWIYLIDPMLGYIDVDEQTAIKLRRLINDGKYASYRDGEIKVKVGLADEAGYSMDAKIDWVDSVLNAGTGTQIYRCVVWQPRKDGKPQVLVSPGMFIRVQMPVSTPRSALLIHEKAVGSDQENKFVYVVNKSSHKVERRNVKLGQAHEGLRVVEMASPTQAGLTADDMIIVSGLQRVQIGMPVDAKEWKEEAPAGVAAVGGR